MKEGRKSRRLHTVVLRTLCTSDEDVFSIFIKLAGSTFMYQRFDHVLCAAHYDLTVIESNFPRENSSTAAAVPSQEL